jgi:phosphoribosylformylglycinamidine synthase
VVGTREGYDAPPLSPDPGVELVVAGPVGSDLGGSEYLAREGGSDRFPTLPSDPRALVEGIASVADLDSTVATHDVSHGGLSVALAEMVGPAGVEAALPGEDPAGELFGEAPGRAVVATTDPDDVAAALDGVAPVTRVGETVDQPRLSIAAAGRTLRRDADEIRAARSVVERELG